MAGERCCRPQWLTPVNLFLTIVIEGQAKTSFRRSDLPDFSQGPAMMALNDQNERWGAS